MISPLLTGFLLDQVVGDPRSLPHPVVLLGKTISFMEKKLNQGSPQQRKAKGVLMGLFLIGGSYALPWTILKSLETYPYVRFGLETLLIAAALAGKSLLDAGKAVLKPLEAGELDKARSALAGFVSRDTGTLNEGEIARGTVETLAENFVDGILSPLFYAALGGAPLAWAFKAVSTLDSMVGYRNARYLDFGWFSARADDWANYLPARLSLPLLLVAGSWKRLEVRRALRMWRRDARFHPSPNGGNPESIVAGLFGVQLGGMNVYEGKPTLRATLGDPVNPLAAKHIRDSLSLVRLASWLALLCFVGIIFLVSAFGLNTPQGWDVNVWLFPVL